MTDEPRDDEPRRDPDEQRFPADDVAPTEPVRAPIDESADNAAPGEEPATDPASG